MSNANSYPMDTPRTDALEKKWAKGRGPDVKIWDHARQLERELSALRLERAMQECAIARLEQSNGPSLSRNRAVEIAMEVIEADLRAGARGLCHPPLEWEMAVELARAVSCMQSETPSTSRNDGPYTYDQIMEVAKAGYIERARSMFNASVKFVQSETVYRNPFKVVTSEWDTTRNENEVPCHTRMVDGVLCRWWGDDMPPGVALIDKAAEKSITDAQGGPVNRQSDKKESQSRVADLADELTRQGLGCNSRMLNLALQLERELAGLQAYRSACNLAEQAMPSAIPPTDRASLRRQYDDAFFAARDKQEQYEPHINSEWKPLIDLLWDELTARGLLSTTEGGTDK